MPSSPPSSSSSSSSFSFSSSKSSTHKTPSLSTPATLERDPGSGKEMRSPGRRRPPKAESEAASVESVGVAAVKKGGGAFASCGKRESVGEQREPK